MSQSTSLLHSQEASDFPKPPYHPGLSEIFRNSIAAYDSDGDNTDSGSVDAGRTAYKSTLVNNSSQRDNSFRLTNDSTVRPTETRLTESFNYSVDEKGIIDQVSLNFDLPFESNAENNVLDAISDNLESAIGHGQILYFGRVAVNCTRIIRIRICNPSESHMEVRAWTCPPPFRLPALRRPKQSHGVWIPPRSFILLPVVFAPRIAGIFDATLTVVCVGEKLMIQLNGESYKLR